MNGPAQLLVPVYVPEIVEPVTPVAVPLIVAVHPGNPDIPPVGTVMRNVNVVPERVPERLPAKATVPRGVVAITGPDTELPDCEIVHAMFPGPVESDADPEYMPSSVVTLGVGEGEVGVKFPEPPPPQPTITKATKATIRRIFFSFLIATPGRVAAILYRTSADRPAGKSWAARAQVEMFRQLYS